MRFVRANTPQCSGTAHPERVYAGANSHRAPVWLVSGRQKQLPTRQSAASRTSLSAVCRPFGPQQSVSQCLPIHGSSQTQTPPQAPPLH